MSCQQPKETPTFTFINFGMQISVDQALQELRKGTLPFVELLRRNSFSVEIYKPVKIDKQKPHDRDEVYVVIAGSGTFINGKKEWAFKPGDLLFVPAGVEHRFVDFTDDFSTWVIFF